ncbi:MAG: carbamoyltransferase HypF [Frankiaceae bacterium]
MAVRCLIRVEGIVQGVGFRPFVHRVATELGLAGHVGNDARGVFIEAQGEPAAVEALIDALRHRPPPLAVVEGLTTAPLPCDGAAGFAIVGSDRTGAPLALISPDVATCDDCLAELLDPADRRYRYPFVNCTNCGPRFTIITGVPYDRPSTTMAGFAMCADCRREYDDPADRRFHAQPVCCPACGPRLVLRAAAGGAPIDEAGDPIARAAELLRAGAVVAVKGLGGYHLAADARDERAVAALRGRKHREDKPFAVLCADLAAAAGIVRVDDAAAALLSGPQRPIVLLPRRTGRGSVAVAPSVAPGNRDLGTMLPYAPLHHLLSRAAGGPIVLTSGNVSDEPIAFRDDDALARLSGIADAFLLHDRPIHVRTDDSVVRLWRGRPQPVRRSRGYAPAPLSLPVAADRPILGCGAELKSVFALARGRRAFLSHHVGDLENAETLRSFVDGIAHFRRLLAIEPEVVAHDQHPEYLSTKWALELDGVELVAVQHHHAHIASCLADNGETGPVIGVAFDGLGHGTDGTLWGGELLAADLTGFARMAHLEVVPMPGGARAVREPWRMAVSWLATTYGDRWPDGLDVRRRHGSRWDDVAAVARSALSPRTSSVGRLFDAVAAICGVRDAVTYEGQAAIQLEQAADRGERGSYPLPLDGEVLRGTELIAAVVTDVLAGVPVPVVATRFHRGLAVGAAAACAAVRERTGLAAVALSGGVLQNQLLLDLLVGLLERDGFRVLTHVRVPPNDGGISLGQVAVAAAMGGAPPPAATSI